MITELFDPTDDPIISPAAFYGEQGHLCDVCIVLFLSRRSYTRSCSAAIPARSPRRSARPWSHHPEYRTEPPADPPPSGWWTACFFREREAP